MATDKTPNHKRIKRAEEGRDEWKIKALSRREEIVRLTTELNQKTERFKNLHIKNNEIKKELNKANKRITKLEKEIEDLKKKYPARG